MLHSLLILQKDFTEEELEDVFDENNTNRKESLAPIYVRDYLLEHKNIRYKANDIHKILIDEHELKLNLNAVRRILNTITMYDDKCHRIRDGHNFYYVAADDIPEGYLSDDMFDDKKTEK